MPNYDYFFAFFWGLAVLGGFYWLWALVEPPMRLGDAIGA